MFLRFLEARGNLKLLVKSHKQDFPGRDLKIFRLKGFLLDLKVSRKLRH